MGERAALRNDGIPTVGFTWYSLTDQSIGTPRFASRTATSIRSACTISIATSARSGEAYKQLIKDWRDVLPASSVCLTVPIVPPSQCGVRRTRCARRPSATAASSRRCATSRRWGRELASAPDFFGTLTHAKTGRGEQR
jgi:hypothetical protein